jgi:hypothetical protein
MEQKEHFDQEPGAIGPRSHFSKQLIKEIVKSVERGEAGLWLKVNKSCSAVFKTGRQRKSRT